MNGRAWLNVSHSPVGTANVGALLHPEIKAAQKTALAVSLKFIGITCLAMGQGKDV